MVKEGPEPAKLLAFKLGRGGRVPFAFAPFPIADEDDGQRIEMPPSWEVGCQARQQRSAAQQPGDESGRERDPSYRLDVDDELALALRRSHGALQVLLEGLECLPKGRAELRRRLLEGLPAEGLLDLFTGLVNQRGNPLFEIASQLAHERN